MPIELPLGDAGAGISLRRFDCVYIDELQFFAEPESVIRFMVEAVRLRVVAAGLSADYRMQPFGNVLPLIAQADSVNPELEGEKIGLLQASITNLGRHVHTKTIAFDEEKRRINKLNTELSVVWDSYEYEFQAFYHALKEWKSALSTAVQPQKLSTPRAAAESAAAESAAADGVPTPYGMPPTIK
jgi:hypothetical protein